MPDAQRICKICARRPTQEGGRGSCRLPVAARADFAAGLRDCAVFRLGDMSRRYQARLGGWNREAEGQGTLW